jgi:hypothetical protein
MLHIDAKIFAGMPGQFVPILAEHAAMVGDGVAGEHGVLPVPDARSFGGQCLAQVMAGVQKVLL